MGLLNTISLKSLIYVRRLRFAIYSLMLIFSVGVFGFMSIEGMGFVDAFFMTVITMSTVGFGEPEGGLSHMGRIFVSFLIIINLGIFTYAVSIIGSFILEGQFRKTFKNLRVEKAISKLHNHTIVCGFGRNGLQACDELYEHKKPFVVIEMDHQRVEVLKDEKKYLVIEGDATQDEVLQQAGIKNAASLISALPKDADNVFVVLTAKEMNPQLNIISRASEESSELKLHRAGANYVIMPERIGGAHMARMVTNPDIEDFFSVLTSHGGVSINFEELDAERLPTHLKNKTINELDVRSKTGANIIGLKTPDGQYVVNPAANTRLVGSTKLIVLGSEEQLSEFKRLFMTG